MPTLTFGVLYCFFVIGHDRRTILHCKVTRQPNAWWIVLQLREAWGYEPPHRFLIFDRDAKFLLTSSRAQSRALARLSRYRDLAVCITATWSQPENCYRS